MAGLEQLGAAAVDEATLSEIVGRHLDLGGGIELDEVSVEEYPYDLPSITTAGRYLVRGRGHSGRRDHRFGLFVKVVQAFSRSPLFAQVPPELRELADRTVPWRTEVNAYRSDLGRRLPAGLRMPTAVLVQDLEDRQAALWLEEVAVVPAPWDSARYARAARLLGRLAGSARVAELAGLSGIDWTLRTYLEGRLLNAVVPALHDEGVWSHPLVAGTFDDELRRRLLAAAGRAAELVEEAMSLPHTASHGDACPNNLLATEGDPDFTLIDYGFWMPQPIGADLGQLLVGNVQVGAERAGDLAARDRANLAAYLTGLREEGSGVAEEDVERGHALHLMLMTGLSSVPFELLDVDPTPARRVLAADRAAIARFCLDRVDATSRARPRPTR
jgi:hypothetical protein